MALMQNAFKHQANTFKTWMQQGNMKLYAKLRKFHIEYTQNGERFNTYRKQVLYTICPKPEVGTLQPSKQHATEII